MISWMDKVATRSLNILDGFFILSTSCEAAQIGVDCALSANEALKAVPQTGDIEKDKIDSLQTSIAAVVTRTWHWS